MANRKLKIQDTLFAILIVLAISPAWAKDLPRRHDLFELGASYAVLGPQLAAFNCHDRGAQACECILMGYPRKDDFLVLRFYQGTLVAIAQFQSDASLDDLLKENTHRLGKPTLPEYKSDRAIVYIWNDKKTHITLTHLIGPGYVIYEVRDIEKEPLYRKALGY